jgi:hypothetical protein
MFFGLCVAFWQDLTWGSTHAEFFGPREPLPRRSPSSALGSYAFRRLSFFTRIGFYFVNRGQKLGGNCESLLISRKGAKEGAQSAQRISRNISISNVPFFFACFASALRLCVKTSDAFSAGCPSRIPKLRRKRTPTPVHIKAQK